MEQPSWTWPIDCTNFTCSPDGNDGWCFVLASLVDLLAQATNPQPVANAVAKVPPLNRIRGEFMNLVFQFWYDQTKKHQHILMVYEVVARNQYALVCPTEEISQLMGTRAEKVADHDRTIRRTQNCREESFAQEPS